MSRGRRAFEQRPRWHTGIYISYMSLLKSSEPQISCFLQVISRLPVQQQRSCETLQHRPAIIKLHHRFRATFVDAHEEHIASIAVTLARGHAFHYPPDLGNMLLEALSTLHEPTGKVQALVLDACAKMHCKGCLLYTSPSPRDRTRSRMPSSA